MKNKTLLTAALLGAFAASAAFAQDADNQPAPGYMFANCDNITKKIDYVGCLAVSRLASYALTNSIYAAIDGGKFKPEEIEQVIVPVMVNDQSCVDLVSKRETMMEEVRAFLQKDKGQPDVRYIQGLVPVTGEQFRAAADLFKDMGVCYNNIASQIKKNGSPALQEIAPAYEGLAGQARAVEEDFSAKIQP